MFLKNHAKSSKNWGGFWRLIFKKSCSKNYEEKIKRNLVLRDFQKIMLKKIPIKNKKKCRFATKAQKLLKIKSKRASELRKSPSKPGNSSKPSKASKPRISCFLQKQTKNKKNKKKCLFATKKAQMLLKIENKRMNEPPKSIN